MRIILILALLAVLLPAQPAQSSAALQCRTRYTRTGKPWCECRTAGGRWAPWPMPFCRLQS